MKSLGEKFYDAATAGDTVPPWSEIADDEKSYAEHAGLAFAASLSHDETATATIEGLREALTTCHEALKMLTAPDAIRTTTVGHAWAQAVAAELAARKALAASSYITQAQGE